MTSEGGGAVAFPVMTLALGVRPTVARDFSMLIQSVGMSAAAFALLFQRVRLEWRALLLCSIGGSLGTVLGLHYVDPHLTAAQKKMVFVSVWFSFAFALFFLNRTHKRTTFSQIAAFSKWKACVLLACGLVGGMFTSLAGSGVDICSFSVLTLLFRVSEKVATPTSVVLMATVSVVGSYWRVFVMRAVAQETWENFAVCVPIVCVMAPLGATLGSHFHRLVLAAIVYFIDVFALVSAYIIIRPLNTELIVMSVVIVAGGGMFFFGITKLGERLMTKTVEENEISEIKKTETTKM